MYWGSKLDHLQNPSVHLGSDRLPTFEELATGSIAATSPLRKSSSDVLDRTLVLYPVDLGL